MRSLLRRIESWHKTRSVARDRFAGSIYTRTIIDGMIPDIVRMMKGMDLSDYPKYDDVRLMPLGYSQSPVLIAKHLSCPRLILLGEDGKIYILGPKQDPLRLTAGVINVLPYSVKDAKGDDGIPLTEIADLLATYHI